MNIRTQLNATSVSILASFLAINELAFHIKFEFDISAACFKKFRAISLTTFLSLEFHKSRWCGKNE